MEPYATIEDITALWRPLSPEETTRAAALLPIVSDRLRQEAINLGLNLDEMIDSGQVLSSTAKSVTVDVVKRSLTASTTDEAMTQYSQSAGGYSVSGTLLNPDGRLFIFDAEKKALGIKRRQTLSMVKADIGIFEPKPNPGE